MAILLFLLFMVVLIYGLEEPSSPRGVSQDPRYKAGLVDEHGHLTPRGMAFYDGLDGSFDGAPPDITGDWF